MFMRERIHLRNVHSAVFLLPSSKSRNLKEMAWACEHEVGVAQGSLKDIMMDLRANY